MIRAKVAKTPSEIEQGLMFVEHLPEDEGMLFSFPRPNVLNFWGKNTLIPLDIAFIDDKKIIRHIGSIQPMSLRAISSIHKCHYALEVNAGYFEKNNIKVGMRIDIDSAPPARISSLLSHEQSSPFYFYISFSASGQNIEGNCFSSKKEKLSSIANLRVSQMMDELGLGNTVPKRDEKRVGDPIAVGPESKTQVDPQNLPVLSPEEIGAKLEDEFDPEEMAQIQQKELQDQQKAEEPQEAVQPEKQYPVFANAFQASEWAEQNSEVMRIEYTTSHGRQLIRDIEPHGQFHSKSTHRQILVTFDRTIGDIRAFIMTNINEWSFIGQQFQKKFIVRG